MVRRAHVQRIAVLLSTVPLLIGACSAKGKQGMRAGTKETIEKVGKEVGLTFPKGTKLIGVHRERGADDLIAVKVEMAAAAWSAFLETTPIKADEFRPGERGLLGPDHGFWDPRRAGNLRTAEAALPGSRVLNLGYDDSQGAAIVVFIVNHGT